MIPVKLTKVKTNHSRVRTHSMEGQTVALPEVGKRFQVFGEPLSGDGDIRVITTSVVQKCSPVVDDKMMIETLNSIYEVELL